MTRDQLHKLKVILFDKGLTYRDCATVLGISVAAFCAKMNGKSKFTVPQAKALSDYANLSNDQFNFIFL